MSSGSTDPLDELLGGRPVYSLREMPVAPSPGESTPGGDAGVSVAGRRGSSTAGEALLPMSGTVGVGAEEESAHASPKDPASPMALKSPLSALSPLAGSSRYLSRYSGPGGSGVFAPVLEIPANMRRFVKADVKIDRKKRLGKGGFAEVFLGEIFSCSGVGPAGPAAVLTPNASGNRATGAAASGAAEIGRKVAVKVMNKQEVSRSSFVNLQHELDICATLNHPCVVNHLGIFQDDTSIYILMDLAEGGELFKYTKKYGLEDMPLVAPNFIGEVVLGLEYMANLGVAHRDIKPENLLLTADYHVKIADFGTVCRVSEENHFTGTAQYVSPEVIAGHVSKVSDIWALGCTLYQLFVGRPPFEGDSEYQVLQNIKARKFEFPPYFPPAARDLVDRMLEMDPTKRIGYRSFDEIRQHPFFTSVDWANILSSSNITHLNEDFDKKYAMFLDEDRKERVMYCSPASKERYMAFSVKERILILTNLPRLFYLEPATNMMKGEVPWTNMLCAQADSDTRFHVYCSPERTYHFVCKDNRAGLWAAKINDLVKCKRGAPGAKR